MITFRFSLTLGEGESSTGAEFGGMEVVGSLARASSREMEPPQPMLIQHTVATLLDELAPVIKSGRGRARVQGTASKFSLGFQLKKNQPMVVTSGKTLIAQDDALVVACAVWSAAREFADQWLKYIPEDDPLRPFFLGALDRFQEATETRRRTADGSTAGAGPRAWWRGPGR